MRIAVLFFLFGFVSFSYNNVIAIRSSVKYVDNKWLFYSQAMSSEPA